MTARAIAGLAVYNLFLLGVGAGVLWGVRGWRWWTDFVRLAGVAYLLGIAALMTLLTLELVLGIPISAVTIVASGIALVVLGLVAGRLRAALGARPATARLELPGAHALQRSLRRGDRRLPRGAVPGGSALGNHARVGRLGVLDAESAVVVLLRAPRAGLPGPAPAGALVPAGDGADPVGGVPRHRVGRHRVPPRPVLVPGSRLRRSGRRPARGAGAPGDPVPAAARVPRLAEPRRADHDGVLGRPARLLHRDCGVARRPLDRGAEAVAARRRDDSPRRCGADEARGAPPRSLRPARGVRHDVAGVAEAVASARRERRGRARAHPAVADLVHRPRSRGRRPGRGLPRRRSRTSTASGHRSRLAFTTLFEGDLWRVAPFVAVAAIVLAAIAGAWRVSVYAAAFLGLVAGRGDVDQLGVHRAADRS